MKNATLILDVIFAMCSCSASPGSSKAASQTTTKGNKDNFVFAWLSSTSGPQT